MHADCEPFPDSDTFHSCRGTEECNCAWCRRHSWFCPKCKQRKYGECHSSTSLGFWDEAVGSYNNDCIWLPLLPKQRTAPERAVTAEAYGSTLTADSWVAIDCADADPDHTWRLAKARGTPYAATADVVTPDGSASIKKGYPVLDFDFYECYDPYDSCLFKPHQLADTVHLESLITVQVTIDAQRLTARSTRVRVSAATATAVGEALELRQTSATPAWCPCD